MRAYNDWHLEAWCGAHPDRFIPNQIPWLRDPRSRPTRCAATRRAGFRAVTFSEAPEKLGLPSLHTGYWDPLLRACEETETVVCLHVGSSGASPMTAPDAPPETVAVLFFGVGDVRRGRLALLEDAGAVPGPEDLPLRGRHRLGGRPARPARPLLQVPGYLRHVGGRRPHAARGAAAQLLVLRARRHVGASTRATSSASTTCSSRPTTRTPTAPGPTRRRSSGARSGTCRVPTGARSRGERRRSCSATRCPRRSPRTPTPSEGRARAHENELARMRQTWSSGAAPSSTAPARPARRADVAMDDGRIVARRRRPRRRRRRSTPRAASSRPASSTSTPTTTRRCSGTRALTSSCWHGVTSVVAGNCGFSIAPTRPEHRGAIVRTLQASRTCRSACSRPASTGDFETFAEYLDAGRARAAPILNFGCYVGHSPVRLFVMGDDGYEREASPEEIERMRAVVAEAMRAGALGFASSFSANHRGDRGLPVPSRNGTRRRVRGARLGARRARLRRRLRTRRASRVTWRDSYELQPRIGRPLMWTPMLTHLSGARPPRDDATSTRRAGPPAPTCTRR